MGARITKKRAVHDALSRLKDAQKLMNNQRERRIHASVSARKTTPTFTQDSEVVWKRLTPATDSIPTSPRAPLRRRGTSHGGAFLSAGSKAWGLSWSQVLS